MATLAYTALSSPWPPNVFRSRCYVKKKLVEKRAAELASGVRRPSASAIAANRSTTENAFRLPPVGIPPVGLPPVGLPPVELPPVHVFSVSTAINKERVIVILEYVQVHDKQVLMVSCTSNKCRRQVVV